jgi:hypothetical protein
MNDDQGGGVARRRGLRLPGGGRAENVLALRMVSGRVSIGRLTARHAHTPHRSCTGRTNSWPLRTLRLLARMVPGIIQGRVSVRRLMGTGALQDSRDGDIERLIECCILLLCTNENTKHFFIINTNCLHN